MTKVLRCVGISSAALLTAYVASLRGGYLMPIVSAAIGAAWLAGFRPGIGKYGQMFFGGQLLVLVWACFGEISGELALLAAVFLLGAIDLDDYFQRVRSIKNMGDTALDQGRWIRLAVTLGVSATLGLASLNLQGNLGFWVMVAVAGSVVVALSHIVAFVRRR